MIMLGFMETEKEFIKNADGFLFVKSVILIKNNYF